jgi:DNA-binding HxlR family transcriptional regulator
MDDAVHDGRGGGCARRPPVCARFRHAAELVGRRWSASVIRVTLDGPARFTEIRGSIQGISARLLAERLRELEAEGVLERRASPADPALGEYHLTPKGRALAAVMTALQQWADEWEAEGSPPVRGRRPPGPGSGH